MSKPPDQNQAPAPDRRHATTSAPPAGALPVSYDRQRDLPALVAVWPAELADTSPAARRHLLGKLQRALRAERRRGLAGHWTYDLARHAQLLSAYRAEMSAADFSITTLELRT